MLRKAIVLISIMLLLVLTSCGKSKMLEEYFIENPSEQELLDQAGAEMADLLGVDMDIEVDGNDIIYTYALDEIPTGEEAEMAKDSLKNAHDQMNTAAQMLIETVEKSAKVDGVTVTMIYMDQEGKVFFSYVYE